MKTLLAEQPLIVSLMLGAFSVALLYGWLQTGKQAAAVIGLLIALLIPGEWWLAAHWKTDREEIRELILETADAVRVNDIERVVRVIMEERQGTIAQARSELARFEFDDARVTGIRQIDVVAGTYPPEADVDINVVVVVSDKRGQFASLRVPRRLQFQMRKIEANDGSGPRWFVTDYNHMPPVGQPDAYSPQSN
tara:strand:+ start:327509 stop:328090 length:582 start_codon:yes stop_codon:yes gene_type:complete